LRVWVFPLAEPCRVAESVGVTTGVVCVATAAEERFKAASKATTLKSYEVPASKEETVADTPDVVAESTKAEEEEAFQYTRYPETERLSVEAVQDKDTEEEVLAVADSPLVAVGGTLSKVVALKTVLGIEELPAASKAITYIL